MFKEVELVLLVILLAGCDQEARQARKEVWWCESYTSELRAIEACVNDASCQLTTEDYRDKDRAERGMGKYCE